MGFCRAIGRSIGTSCKAFINSGTEESTKQSGFKAWIGRIEGDIKKVENWDVRQALMIQSLLMVL